MLPSAAEEGAGAVDNCADAVVGAAAIHTIRNKKAVRVRAVLAARADKRSYFRIADTLRFTLLSGCGLYLQPALINGRLLHR